MKLLRLSWIILILASILTASPTKIKFEDYFTKDTMRIDYHHIWDGSKELISLDRIYREGEWAGNRNVLLDPFKYGKYRIKLFTEDSSKMIFSKGFDSYFGEYITTDTASKGIKKTYHETALIPDHYRDITSAVPCDAVLIMVN